MAKQPIPQKIDDGTVAGKIQGKRKSIQAAAKAHAAANEIRLHKIQDVQASYNRIKGELALTDLLEMCSKFQKYHLKLAQDGVGARETGHKLVDGTAEVENFFLDNNQRAGHLDKAAGIQEIIDYMDRQINPPTAKPVVKPEPVKTV